MEQAIEAHGLRLHAAGAASAGTAVNGDTQDMQGFDGALIFGTIATANAGNFLKLQHGDASDASDMADVAGSKVVADANGEVVAIDVVKPLKRYVRGVMVRAGANTITGDVYILKYNGQSRPVTNSVTNTHKFVKLNGPASGAP